MTVLLFVVGATLVAAAGMLAASGPLFLWQREVVDMPAASLSIGLVVCGALYFALMVCLRRQLASSGGLQTPSHMLLVVIVVGLACRLVLLPSTPALEDDSYRYLWDGAVTAHGLNPYAVAPQDARLAAPEKPLARLAQEAGVVLERINHAHLKTIYPPVAQAAFALAHLIEPWSLMAWRLVCLAGELATLGLLIVLLDLAGRSRLWLAAYWWNPVVIKELINSAHMEAILIPLVLASLVLSIRKYHIAAVAVIGLAIGTKLWPILLVPLLMAPLRKDPTKMIIAFLSLGILALAWAIPPLLGGLDGTSGFVAFAKYWQTNSALMPMLTSATGFIVEVTGLQDANVGMIVRGILGILLASWTLWLASGATGGAHDTLTRGTLIVAGLVLLSPAQFPWYTAWMAPFLCFVPSLGLFAVTPLVPLYYLSFHFEARGIETGVAGWLVWMIWVPVWLLLAWETYRAWRQGSFAIERID